MSLTVPSVLVSGAPPAKWVIWVMYQSLHFAQLRALSLLSGAMVRHIGSMSSGSALDCAKASPPETASPESDLLRYSSSPLSLEPGSAACLDRDSDPAAPPRHLP